MKKLTRFFTAICPLLNSLPYSVIIIIKFIRECVFYIKHVHKLFDFYGFFEMTSLNGVDSQSEIRRLF